MNMSQYATKEDMYRELYNEINEAYGAEMKANAEARALIKCIQDALGTEEKDDALIEVARKAHRAEQELASWECKFLAEDHTLAGALQRIVKWKRSFTI